MKEEEMDDIKVLAIMFKHIPYEKHVKKDKNHVLFAIKMGKLDKKTKKSLKKYLQYLRLIGGDEESGLKDCKLYLYQGYLVIDYIYENEEKAEEAFRIFSGALKIAGSDTGSEHR